MGFLPLTSPTGKYNATDENRTVTSETESYVQAKTPHQQEIIQTPETSAGKVVGQNNTREEDQTVTSETEKHAPSPVPNKTFIALTSSPSTANFHEGDDNRTVSSGSQSLYSTRDEKLLARLYNKIENQESEYRKLKLQHTEEQKQRERLESELEETKKEIQEQKKRFNNFKKQEREFRNKCELDQKERHREDVDRWESTMEEMVQMRKELTTKTAKLAEFEFHCLKLQQSLDLEKGQRKTDLAEAEKRITLSSEMLQTCHDQLTRADKQLKKERKMKQILIKINEALQIEIKRLQEQVVQIKQQTELQISQSLSMQQSKESDGDNTNEIIQDLQIEDALFYFEEVKRQYEDRPRVYRVFLEVLRDYKGRTLSTPEVIARISKLFQGNSKLIIGFNRFLPKDYHISEQDVADMQGYNGAAPAAKAPPPPPPPPPAPAPVPVIAAPTAVVVGTAPPPPPVIASPRMATTPSVAPTPSSVVISPRIVAKGQDKGKQWRNHDEVSYASSNRDEKSVGTETAEEVQSRPESRKKEIHRHEKRENQAKKRDKKARRKANKDDHSPAALSRSSGKGKKKSSTEKRAAKESKIPLSDASKLEIDDIPPPPAPVLSASSFLVENPSLPIMLTINTSSPVDEDSMALPPVKKPPGDLKDDYDDETATCPETDFAGTEFASPTVAEISSPRFEKFQSFNLSTVASSHVFGGIESIDDSFGIGILSLDQTTLYMPSDRYEVIEDQEYNAIEMIADHHTAAGSSYHTRRSSSSSSYWNKL